jgi:hypothetical protein
MMLTYLPKEAREQMTLLEKMRKVLKGVHNARVDLVYLVAGMFSKPKAGIVQCYGVQAVDPEKNVALARATEAMAGLCAVMANFEQSRLEPLTVDQADWIRQAFETMPFATVAVGHPDPRDNPRGMDGRGAPGVVSPATQMSLQQNEMVFRGMASQEHEFVNVVITSAVGDPADIYRLQERVAQEASIWKSKVFFTKAISAGLTIPLILSGALDEGSATSYGVGETEGVTDTVGESQAVSHAEGVSHGRTTGEARTLGIARGEASSHGSSVTHATTRSHTTGIADGVSHVDSEGWGEADTSMWAHTEGQSWNRSVSEFESEAKSHTIGLTHSASLARSYEFGASALLKAGTGATIAEGYAGSEATGVTTVKGSAVTESRGGFVADTVGGAHTDSHNWGVADGKSHVDSATQGVAHTTAVSQFSSHTSSVTRSQAQTQSRAESVAESVSDAVSRATSRSHGTGRSTSTGRSQTWGAMRGVGVATGISPSLSLSKSFQGEDHVAKLVADALEQQEAMLAVMAREGGVLVDNYFLARTPEGRKALSLLIPQAYHGLEEVVTPVRTRHLTPEEEEYIRQHAWTFTPSTRLENNPWLLEPWKDSTLLTLLQASAYVAPGAFEEGTAVTIQERIPNCAFMTEMSGEVVLGHQFSSETAQLTSVPARLSLERMSNWAFCADTRFGKSVAAERLALEIVTRWKHRVVVLDFGLGWRKLLSMLPRKVGDLYSLYQGGPRPIRWNPLQMGRRIPPDLQLDATVELMCNAGRMGERQAGWLWQVMRGLYVEYGVLTEDPVVLYPETHHPDAGKKTTTGAYQQAVQMAHVSDRERSLLNQERAKKGMRSLPTGEIRLERLEPWERQLLAIERSKQVDLTMVYDRLDHLYNHLPRGQTTDQQAIKGILLRLKTFRYGQLAAMYGRGEGSLAIEDLGLPHGLVVLEGGHMPEYAKAVVLSLIAWHLYQDAVIRRRESIGRGKETPMFLVFEEGNKIITGIPGRASDDRPVGQGSEIFQSMFRDAGKYNIFLGVLLQSPAELPPGILSSCNNLMVGQLKNPRDRDVVLPAIGRSEKGFWYVDYANFVGRMAQGQMILKLGLSQDIAQIEPLLIRPLMVEATEPQDEKIRQYFDRRQVAIAA